MSTFQTVATHTNRYPTMCGKCHLYVRPGACTAKVYSEDVGSYWLHCECADRLVAHPWELDHLLEPLPPVKPPPRHPRKCR